MPASPPSSNAYKTGEPQAAIKAFFDGKKAKRG